MHKSARGRKKKRPDKGQRGDNKREANRAAKGKSHGERPKETPRERPPGLCPARQQASEGQQPRAAGTKREANKREVSREVASRLERTTAEEQERRGSGEARELSIR